MPRLLLIRALLFPGALLSVASRPAAGGEPNALPAVNTTKEEAAGQKSLAVPVPPASPEAMRYYRSGNVLWTVFTLWRF